MNDQMVKVLWVHGWASNATVWSRCALRLKKMLHPATVTFDFVEMGYFGDPCCEIPSGHFDLGVGHSAGLARLLGQSQAAVDNLVSIGGFTRFCSSECFDAGWSPKIVDRMRRRFAVSPNEVIEDFWQKASSTQPGQANPPLSLDKTNVDRMLDDLNALPAIDCRQQWSSFAGAKVVIAGTADQIVGAEHSQHCFGDQHIEWIQTDSHWIPWTFPETCAALLREMIETY